ncbi:DMT family transporter [Neotabrizicola shimadae]|uniref:DMT family transporter n=1 Tax=Neotabrizicola shimadae TaxID=2807096 RepID=A0A8G1ECR9_9RHOB|nr:DMT family transporter [Neotabrizicola shimadae]QYZ70930.1 DMT family transporter [Neotabrizicola shimadae]
MPRHLAAPDASGNLRGILLMVASMALFAIEDMFLKLAAASLPVGQIIFVSGAFAIPVFWALARREGAPFLTRDLLHPALLLRNLGEVVGSLGYVAALAAVPLSTVSAVLQATPLAVTMGAALFLGERVGWRRWTAILVGFAGVLLVVQPGGAEFRPQALWVLVTVAGIALRDLATRAVPARITTHQISAWGVTSVALLGLAMMAITGKGQLPSLPETASLAGALVFGTSGYWAITAAMREGEVSVVSPFRYTRLVFAMSLGILVFAERPDALTLFGAAVIIGSGLYAFARERARKRALSQSPSAG